MLFLFHEKKETKNKEKKREVKISFPKSVTKSINKSKKFLIEDELIRQKNLFLSLYESPNSFLHFINDEAIKKIVSNNINDYLTNWKEFDNLKLNDLIAQNEDLSNKIKFIEDKEPNNHDNDSATESFDYEDLPIYKLLSTTK